MGRRSTRRSDENGAQPPKRARRHRYNTRYSSRAKRDKLLGGEQDGRKTIISDEEFRDKNKVLKEEKIGSPLIVKELDTMNEENREKHHTDMFKDQDDLIVRRGAEFFLNLIFDRKVNTDSDVIVLQFSFGPRPQESKGTIIRETVNFTSCDKDGWSVTATEVNEEKVTVAIVTEPDCCIGKYALFVETKLKSGGEDFSRAELDETLYVLFNPWCEDDLVYMEKEEERDEYVLNDQGYIWVGSARFNTGRPWDFGQFESPVLEVALELLDKAELLDTARNSPLLIVRCMSALVNSNDEDGLLEGRWGSDYPKDCTLPWKWTGSGAICEEFYKTKKPVRFGQCWVFSGVVTSLLRCLGIPTRSVTNFESAHDTDESMTIDRHYDEDDNALEELDDSVWNFHVWNESYFKRIDLPDGYDGWQAHDATPQELSGGVMRCGPAPVTAIKKGHVYLNFETGFIFSEVNGDKVTWVRRDDGSMEVTCINRHAVGMNISTKAVGSKERQDLTHDYKYPEGSKEEREVAHFVNRFSTRRRQNIYNLNLEEQVKLDLVTPDGQRPGDDLEVGVKVINSTPGKKNVRIKLTLASAFYTGVVGKHVQQEVFEKAIEDGESEMLTMTVPFKQYEPFMNGDAKFKLTAVCRMLEQEKKHVFVTDETFQLKAAELTFKIPEKIPSYTDLVIPVTFKNETGLKIHKAEIRASGAYLVKDKTKVYTAGKTIYPGEEFTAEVAINSRRIGERTIMATFGSDELSGDGEATITVISKSEYEEEMDTEDKAE